MDSTSRSVAPSSRTVPESAWDRDAKVLGRLPWLMGAGLLAVAGFVGFVALGPAQAAPAEPDPAPEPEPTERPQPEAVASAEEDRDPPPTDGSILATGVDPEKLGALDEADTPPTADGPEADPPSEAEPTRVEHAGKPKAESRRPVERTEPAVPAQAAPDPAAKIESALSAGWMRESGSLLLIFPNNTPLSWSEAKSLCQRRRDAGLTKWRLAGVTQLERLRAARDLPAGTWWSATATDDGLKALTLAPAKKGELSKVQGKALPVCVHPRPDQDAG